MIDSLFLTPKMPPLPPSTSCLNGVDLATVEALSSLHMEHFLHRLTSVRTYGVHRTAFEPSESILFMQNLFDTRRIRGKGGMSRDVGAWNQTQSKRSPSTTTDNHQIDPSPTA